MEWSKGQALIATGSPFPAVTLPDSQRDYIVAECNNVSPDRGGHAKGSGANNID